MYDQAYVNNNSHVTEMFIKTRQGLKGKVVDDETQNVILKATHTTHNLLRKRLAHHPAPPGETGSSRLAVYVPPLGARFSNRSSLPRVRLGISPHCQAPASADPLSRSSTAWHIQSSR
ncbi:hypothetical protein DEO72_LG3g2059 [Vigna unguiculata]|uniref:Uncharacterized protein n=1 Tax=Vigna unguiculata TaxID=3917 RepID=A0A4D6LG96_VIGUN|nr:hypothetical protein DEO72_LG3g2059 [Vigna unguiculata]